MLLGLNNQMSTYELLELLSSIFDEFEPTVEKTGSIASEKLKSEPNEQTMMDLIQHKRENVMDSILCYHINEDERTTEICWNDGTNTKVVADPEDEFDPEFGLMFCIMEYVCGNSKKYLTEIRKMVKKHKNAVALNKKLDAAVAAEEARYKKKVARKIARKERKKREYDVNVMKQALLELKKEGLI